MRERKPAGPAPTEARLHEQALAYLARYAATRAGVARVLGRKVDRWARAVRDEGGELEAEAVARCHAAARAVVDRLVKSGVVDDVAFAESRAKSLTRAGRSRLAVAAHLAARGVNAEQVRAAVPQDGETELSAALVFARKRRIGPFAREEMDETRGLGMLARAGFSREVALRALRMEPEEAEALVIGLKRS